jgi:hypothetical protein
MMLRAVRLKLLKTSQRLVQEEAFEWKSVMVAGGWELTDAI